MDPEVVGSDLGSGGVESYDAFFGVYFAEHEEHVFEVVVVEVEYGLCVVHGAWCMVHGAYNVSNE